METNEATVSMERTAVKASDTTAAKKGKLPLYRKVGYLFGDFGSQFCWTFIGSYLSVFYTDVVGIAPLAVTTIFLIARIWDAVNDPMMGAIAERTHSRWGRFRPYLCFGAPFLAAASILAFTNPDMSTTGHIIYAAVTYIAAGMIYTAVNIPYGAMAGVMTTNIQERNSLSAFRMNGMNIGMLIVNFTAMPLILHFSRPSETANGHGYFMTALIFAIVGCISFYITFFTSKEVAEPVKKEKVPLGQSVKSIVTNRYIVKAALIQFFVMCGFMGRVGVAVYYYIYVLGRSDLVNVLMTLPSVAGIIGIMFVPKIASKLGKKRTVALTNFLTVLALLWIYFIPAGNIGMLYVATFVFGLVSVGSPLILSMLQDAIDYGEYHTGIRADGAAYATNGLASKAGSAIAGIGVSVMAAFGYVANQQQTARALAGINFTVNMLPAIFFLLAFIVSLTWDLREDDVQFIRNELDEHRTADSAKDRKPEEV